MIELVALRENNLDKIVGYNRDKGGDFLHQWGGVAYHYPLTEEQLRTRLALSGRKKSYFEMFEIILDKTEMIGTMELFNIDRETRRATMGRFLIAEEYRGRGYAGQALKAMFRIAKNLYHIEELRLNVYEFNVNAQHCYEKAGFVFESLTEDVKTPKWSFYTYLIELYALDIEAGKRILPDLQPDFIPDEEETAPKSVGSGEEENRGENGNAGPFAQSLAAEEEQPTDTSTQAAGD